jgi:hypothetical protein
MMCYRNVWLYSPFSNKLLVCYLTPFAKDPLFSSVGESSYDWGTWPERRHDMSRKLDRLKAQTSRVH